MSVQSRGIQRVLSGLIFVGAGPVLGAEAVVNSADDSRCLIEEVIIEGECANRLPLKDTSQSSVVFGPESDLSPGLIRGVSAGRPGPVRS